MRYRTTLLAVPTFALLLLALNAGRAEGQGRATLTLGHTLTAVVPSIMRYVVDQTIRTADGAPTVRVISNDPAIRAVYAHGVTPELIPGALASTTPEQSGHAKGGGAAEGTTEAPNVLRYTLVAP